jgi:hypothetical protein
MATMHDNLRRDLVRRLSSAASAVDRIDATDRVWLPLRERDRRREAQEYIARRELRELRERLDGLLL